MSMDIVFFGAQGASQAAHSGNTCFLIRSGDTRLLVDAGGDPILHLLRAGESILDFDALVLTHRHTDHVYGLPSIVHNLRMARRTKPLTIIGNADVVPFAQEVLRAFGLEGKAPLDWQTIDSGSRAAVGELELTFFAARHSAPCHGFVFANRATRAVYGADGGPNPDLAEAGAGASVLIHEATGGAADEATLNADGHSSARQAGQAAAGMAVRTLFLCGMRAATRDADEALREEAESVYPGDVIVPMVDRAYQLI